MKYLIAAALGVTVFAFGSIVFLALLIVGGLEFDQKFAPDLIQDFVFGILQPQSRGQILVSAAILLLGFAFASLGIPLLISRLFLRRKRYVLTTLISSLAIVAAAYGKYVRGATDGIDPYEMHREQEQFTSTVAIDTLTYELMDRLPERPFPQFGFGYGKLRLTLRLDVREAGETRITTVFVGHQTARDIRKTRVMRLRRGVQEIKFDLMTQDFTYVPSIWVEPGNQPGVHPSAREGWMCHAEVTIERPRPGSFPFSERLWGSVVEREFVLDGIEEHDLPKKL